MKLKKICAAFTAVALSAGILSNFPAFDFAMTTEAAVVSDGFEISYDGWFATAPNSVSGNKDIYFVFIGVFHKL